MIYYELTEAEKDTLEGFEVVESHCCKWTVHCDLLENGNYAIPKNVYDKLPEEKKIGTETNLELEDFWWYNNQPEW